MAKNHRLVASVLPVAGGTFRQSGSEEDIMAENPSDPVQLYLTQMSSTPLLRRQEEFEAARRIEHTRKNLRHAMLGSDYVLQAAVGMLEKVAARTDADRDGLRRVVDERPTAAAVDWR